MPPNSIALQSRSNHATWTATTTTAYARIPTPASPTTPSNIFTILPKRSTLSFEEVDETVTFALQYFRAANISASEKGCCSHMLGQCHARFALDCLAKIINSEHGRNPYFVSRFASAWPDIYKWLLYNFKDWIARGKFIGRQEDDRIQGYLSIIPFLYHVIEGIPDAHKQCR
ncbi:hypothetical protein C8R43DRAFT_1127385 [Mycena crocata]|nr:hypothetical protein C8R43DRAFT_1127385 [Mycena crocata]